MKPNIHQVCDRYLVLLLCCVLVANARTNETNLVVCRGKEAKFEYFTDNNTPLPYIHFGEKKEEFLHPQPLLMRVDENDNVEDITGNTSYSKRLRYEGNARAGRAAFILQNTESNDSRRYVIYVREGNSFNTNVTKLDVRDCPTNSTVDHDTAAGKKSTTENGKAGNNSTYTMHPNTTAVSLNPPTPGSDVTNKSNTTTNFRTTVGPTHSATTESPGNEKILEIVLPICLLIIIIIAVLLYRRNKKKTIDNIAISTMKPGAHQGSGSTAGIQTVSDEEKESFLEGEDDTRSNDAIGAMEPGAHQGSGSTAGIQTVLDKEKESFLGSENNTVDEKHTTNAIVDGTPDEV